MRHTVKAFRKLGYCRRVVKGSASDVGALNGSMAVDQKLEIFKGRPCITDFNRKDENPQNKRKGPWKGAVTKKKEYTKKVFAKNE